MKRTLRIGCLALCLMMFLLCCSSCATDTPVSPAPEPEPVEKVPEPVSAEPVSIDNIPETEELPYTFDTETPSEIDNRRNQIHQNTETEEEILESHQNSIYYGYRRYEYSAPDDSINGFPATAPVYIRTYYSNGYGLTEAQLAVAKQNFTRYVTCFENGAVDYEFAFDDYYGGPLNGRHIKAYPDGIAISGVAITCPRDEDWTHPSTNEVLYEIEHNPYVKAACKMQNIEHPSILTEAFIPHEPNQCDWSVVIYEEQNDVLLNAYQSAFRCIRLRSNYDGDDPGKQSMSVQIALTRVRVVQEVPLLPVETAVNKVLEGYYFQSGALFGIGGNGKRDPDSIFAVRLTYHHYLSGDQATEQSLGYVPYYEVYQVDICDTPEEPCQDRTLYPACNRYWKNGT